MLKHPIARFFSIFSLIYFFFSEKNTFPLKAQTLTRLNIPFEVGGKSLPMALVGGLTSPQFNGVDLNGDRRQDLVVFDRNSNVVLTFLNGGRANSPDWTYAPEFAANFPPLNNWALLRDFNNDGAMDIFTLTSVTTAGNSIRVFKGRFRNGRLAFDRMTFGINGDILKYPDSRGFFLNIYANVIDIPAFDDIDNDGDTDILSFENGGGKVYFYRNRSVELGFGRDTLIYELADECWGRFFDNGFQSKPTLGTRAACATGLRKKEDGQVQTRGVTAHPGASLTTYDRDGDGDKDVLISGILFNNMTLLTNGGDKTTAWMNAAEDNFPSNTEGVNISNFPAAYFVDVDNDARVDLLVSPSSTSFAENRDVSWFYKNTGTAQMPVFTFQKKNFLVEDMIDLGEGANPTFVDVDADGLLDLIVGNTSFYLSGGDRDARLFLF
ncbi:MAG: VCBS repeat-containing protein [Saprospiraceae bacterium]|nr:VCBS repeat-containing protein [Saprospiraceae bacterium]